MSVNSDIYEGLMTIAKRAQGGSAGAFSAEVLSVDLPTRSCAVLSISGKEQVEYPNVWLMPEVADGILYVPKVGSTVIVENNKDLQPYVAMWSELDQILYVVANTVFSMTDGLTKFNKGELGGLVNVEPLVSKINALENLVNALLNTVTAFTPAGTLADAAGLKAAILAGLGTGIPNITVRMDIEDTAVAH